MPRPTKDLGPLDGEPGTDSLDPTASAFVLLLEALGVQQEGSGEVQLKDRLWRRAAHSRRRLMDHLRLNPAGSGAGALGYRIRHEPTSQ